MKTEVFSWRISSGLKSKLELEARIRKQTVTAFVDEAVRDRLARKSNAGDEEARQIEIRKAAEELIGSVDLPWPNASERVGELVRAKLRARRAR